MTTPENVDPPPELPSPGGNNASGNVPTLSMEELKRLLAAADEIQEQLTGLVTE